MKLKNIALISVLVIFISGCEQFDQMKEKFMGAKPALTDETQPEAVVDVIATVNGQPITVEVFNSYARARMKQQQGIDIDQHKGMLINELISRQLMVQEATRTGLDKKPQIAAEIQNQRENILSSFVINQYLTKQNVTDEMMQKEYDDFVKNTNFDEYKISHIMVKTKEEADSIIGELDKGENFAQLAKTKSIDPTGKQGGSLGWVSPGKLPGPFAQMLATIKKGKHGSMSSPNGWHIFKMDDVRTKEPPSFEDSKQSMAGNIQKKNLQAFVEKLKTAANIEIKKTEEAPAAEAPADTN